MKKVLSLVLVLALVLGSFSMAFAAETTSASLTDVKESPNANAIAVVSDLGIVNGYPDGTFKGANAVTRAEFAAMITRALNIPESALAGFTSTSFTDVDGYGWAVPYLAYCASKGIINGYGDGTVKPGATITVNEAITMMCRALGYVSEAKELVGTWPANYIALAQSLNLYKDMSAQGTIDRQNAAQVIYNGLTKQMKYIDENGATQTVTGDDKTMLQLLGGDVTNGGESYTLLTNQAQTAVINVYEYVGQRVKTFHNEDRNIIALEVVSTLLDGKYDAAKGVFVVDDVDYDLDATLAATTGVAVANGATTIVNPVLADGAETVIAVKVSGKTIKAVYSTIDWTANSTFKYEADMLDTKKCELNSIPFNKDNNLEIDTASFALLGVAKLSDIEVDDVVMVYTAGTGGKITKVEVGQATVTGKVTKIAGSKYYIDGTAYKVTNGAAPALGETGTALLAYNGKIAFWTAEDAAADNYAVVVKKGNEEDRYGKMTYYVTLFTKEGKEVEYVAASNATSAAAGATADAVVTFSLDKNGKLDTLRDVPTRAALSGKVNATNTRLGTTSLSDNVVVFVQNADGDWELGNIASVDKDHTWADSALERGYLDAKGKIAVLTGVKATVYGSTASYGVINGTSTALDADGGKYHYVEGFIDGKELAAFTDKKANVALGYGKTVTSAGLYKIDVDGEGIVTGAAPVVPASLSAVTNVEVTKVDTAKNELTIGSSVYGVTSNVVVYVWDTKDEKFVLKTSIGSLKGYTVNLYQTDSDLDGYDIVMAWK